MPQFTCPECKGQYESAKERFTCGTWTCKDRRKRRQQREKRAIAARTTPAQIVEKVRQESDTIATRVAEDIIRQELTPVVREALSEAVLQSIADLVALTPMVVANLKDDLLAEETHIVDGEMVVTVDYDRRAKATAQVAKFTIASPALAPQPEAADAQPLQVIIHTPRPSYDVDGNAVQAEDAAAPEMLAAYECDICHQVRPGALFEQGSTRCKDCHAEIKARGLALLTAPAKP